MVTGLTWKVLDQISSVVLGRCLGMQPSKDSTSWTFKVAQAGMCWLLMPWQLGSERENLKADVLRDPSGSYKTSYDLALEVPEYHFCHILLVKQDIKASPDSRRGELNSTS